LGRLRPTRFLGGEFTLDLGRTRRITREWLKRLGSPFSLEKFAAGVICVVNSSWRSYPRRLDRAWTRSPRLRAGGFPAALVVFTPVPSLNLSVSHM